MDRQSDLFALVEHRLGWIERRQAVLAQNVANANTPGYIARDIEPFAASMSKVNAGLYQTNVSHLASTLLTSKPDWRTHPSERSPDGNAVSLNEELTKIADTESAQALVTNLYRKYIGLFRTAIGK